MKAEIMKENPPAEAAWLNQLVGDWTIESNCSMGPDQPPIKTVGTESYRSLDGMWFVGEGTMGPGPDPAKNLFTLGFCAKSKKFVGSFACSVMSHYWIYNGDLDEANNQLVLNAIGPSFTGEGHANYRDVFKFVDANHRKLISYLQSPDGTWQLFMEADYYRVPNGNSPKGAECGEKKTTVAPYVFFGGRCDEAIEFYKSSLGAELQFLMRYNQNPDPMPPGAIPENFLDKVMHASITIGGQVINLSDGCDETIKFSGFRISLTLPSIDAAEKAFNLLSVGAQVDMPMMQTFWTPRFGMLIDKFGVGWMISAA